MKGIVLAGGSGSRLDPITRVASKQLQPVYDKPMIYYPLATLMEAGITDILLVSTPHDTPRFEDLLGDGHQWGVSIDYAVQREPNGIAEALIVGRQFIGGDSVALILGDNIFYGNVNFAAHVAEFERGATIFGYPVSDPRQYGVVEVSSDGRVKSVEEKPDQPRSNLAIPGFYLYDGRAPGFVAGQKPSARGELEITDLNETYLELSDLKVVRLDRGVAWLDSGTHESLLQAANFIATIERRQGLKIACLEEIAYQCGYIARDDLARLIATMPVSEYSAYLRDVVLAG